MMRDVLFIGPHPDDVFISCGGYIIKNMKEINVHVLCMTSIGLKPSSETRIDEEKKAWRAIGADNLELKFFPDGHDTKLSDAYNDITSYIETRVEKHRYRYIFTPWIYDTHQDHRAVANATLSATRYARNIVFYETPSSYDFNPSLYVELSNDVINQKMDVSRIYRTQILGRGNCTLGLDEIILSKAIANGARTRVCKYAEGFVPYRMFM